MQVGQRWNELSGRSRRLILLGAAVEGILKIAALVDIRRRLAPEIRGSKPAWVTAIVLVNSAGGVPLAYFLRGRRRAR